MHTYFICDVIRKAHTNNTLLKEYPQTMSCPADIFPDDEVFHSRESCLLENFYFSHFVLPFDLHE